MILLCFFCVWFGLQDKLCEGGRRYSINTKKLRTQMHLFTDQVKVFLLLSAHQWMREWILYLPQLPSFLALCKLQVFLLPALIPEVSFSSSPDPMHSMCSQCVNSILNCLLTGPAFAPHFSHFLLIYTVFELLRLTGNTIGRLSLTWQFWFAKKHLPSLFWRLP